MTDWLKLALDGAVSNSMLLLAIGFVAWRVGSIERKLDSFITKEVVGALKEAADKEHAAIRREVNGINRRLDAHT